MTEEQLRNSYSEEDLRAVVEEIEGAFADEREAKADAAVVRKRVVKVGENHAKQLGIDIDVLKAVLTDRKIDVKRKANVAKIPASKLELFTDAMGQMSWLPPVIDGETAAQAAARQRQEEIAAVSEAEQAEGERIIDEMMH